MNPTGRFLDILIAFTGMFIIPLMFFGYSQKNAVRLNMTQKADAVLELTVNSGKISEDIINGLMPQEIRGSLIFSAITIERTEYMPKPQLKDDDTEKVFDGSTDRETVLNSLSEAETREPVSISISNDEILDLLRINHELPLCAGDRITITIYARNLFGKNTFILAKRSRGINSEIA